MKTFKEFMLCLEKYYAPDETLPSGKTPLQKHREKYFTKLSKRSKLPKEQQSAYTDKLIKYADKHEKVKRGADNPDFDTSEHDDLIVHHSPGSHTALHHKKTGISYYIDHHKTPSGKRIESISWAHDHDRRDLSRKDSMRIISNAKSMWKQHIEPRFGHGAILHNTPSENENDSFKNTRAKVYQKFGFSGLQGISQYAKVGRPPSPRQIQSGSKTNRIKPRSSPFKNQ